MAKSGGLIEVGIAQATVVMLGLPVFPKHETKTMCNGFRSPKADFTLT
jgi:hypothetical protein